MVSMTNLLTETRIQRNLLGLRWMEEDYGHLTDVALETIISVVEDTTVPQTVRLKLSETYSQEPFWERTVKTAVQNQEELDAENQ